MHLGIILLAGGRGTRMGHATPKQYLPLAGKPIVSYSFDLLNRFGPTVVVCEEEWEPLFSGARFARPGKERQDSVWNGLQQLQGVDAVLVHDGARPLVSEEAVLRLIEEAKQKRAVALGVPVKPTIKVVHAGQVETTPDRTTLWEIQTPQIVPYAWLMEGLRRAQTEGWALTDDLSVIERLGHPTYIIQGDYKNLKITTPEDLAFAESILLNHVSC